MRKITKLIVLAVVLLLALAPAALAQLIPNGKLGPIATYPTYEDPNNPGTFLPGNGYPLWVEDNSIPPIKLDLPIPLIPGVPGPYGDGVNAPTLIFEPPIEGNTLSQATGFGGEAFFFLANSTIDLPNGGRALLVLGIEAAYGSGDPDVTSPPDQFLFSRVRVRFDATVAGTYTVTHPWGVETLEVTAADLGARFSHTFDWGGLAPLCPDQTSCFADGVSGSPGFERILISPKKWVFLKHAPENINLAPDADPIEKNYMVGDGVTTAPVLPRTDGGTVVDFTIVGPDNAFGPGVNTVNSTLFTVSGHIFGAGIPTAGTPPPPVEQQADTVTITRARLRGNAVEVRATSSNGFPMTAELYRGGVGGTLVGSANLGTSGRGNVSFTQTPDTVRVHSTSTNPNILGGAAITPVTN